MFMTDAVVLCLLLYFFFSGWRKGLLRSFIGPLSLLASSIFAIIHYDIFQNAFKSFLIAVLGGGVLAVVIRIFFFLAQGSVKKEYRHPFILSSILGAVGNLAWQGMVVFIALLILPLFPFQLLGMNYVRDDLTHSVSYNLVQYCLLKKIPRTKNLAETLWSLQDPSKIQQLASAEEYRSLVDDGRIQEILADPQIKGYFRTKDFVRLLSHPKVVNLLKDERLVEKLNRLSRKIYEQEKNPPDF